MNRFKDWFEQAQRDFEKAKLDAKSEFYDWACFTSQQAAEKAVKALCMKLKFDVWGHSITELTSSQGESQIYYESKDLVQQ